MRKNRKILVICAIFGLITCLSGMSYAYLRIRKNQDSNNTISTLRCLGVNFEDITNNISLNNAYAISDTEGLKTTSYKFKITNSCDQQVYAKVNLESLNVDAPIGSNHIKIWFNHENLINPKLALLSDETIFARENTTLANASYSNNLIEVDLNSYESTEFELKMWIDENTTAAEGMDKSYLGKITVTVSPNPNTSVTKGDFTMYAYINGQISSTFPTTDNYNVTTECKSFAGASNPVATAKWNNEWVVNIASLKSGDVVCNIYFTEKSAGEILAPNGWYESKEGTLLAAIKRDNSVGTAASVPGRAISSDSEKVLASAADDYGTSYYFRGNIDNNYVVFANMCWRVVRIVGDGSIKLTLYNRNDSGIANPCNETGTDLAFIKYDGTNMKSVFNPKYTNAAYTGFMYGDITSSDYGASHANNADSSVLTNLKTWYDLKLRNYNNKLSDTIWCGDKTYNSRYYATYTRLYNTSEASPTLVCPDINITGIDKNLSKFTASDLQNGNGKLKGNNGTGTDEYKIGLLTADEVAFAGAAVGANLTNTSFYLYSNTGSIYWTMSPSDYHENSGVYRAGVFVITNTGRLVATAGAAETHNQYMIRPAISLKSSTTILSGTGTTIDPYKVNMS